MRGELAVSERLYAALLLLYPKQFRAAYGRQMCLTFRDACRVAYRQNGVSGLLALWLPTLLDLFKSALEERARQGEITMSKARLITLAGPLTILVGAMWLAPSIADLLLRMGPERPERDWDLLVGRTAPGGGELPWMNYAAGFSLLGIMLGYILFGVDALRYKLLPRRNLLPLLLGSTNLVFSLTFDWFGVPAYFPSQWVSPFLYSTLTGTCWVLLGIAMLNRRPEPQPSAAL